MCVHKWLLNTVMHFALKKSASVCVLLLDINYNLLSWTEPGFEGRSYDNECMQHWWETDWVKELMLWQEEEGNKLYIIWDSSVSTLYCLSFHNPLMPPISPEALVTSNGCGVFTGVTNTNSNTSNTLEVCHNVGIACASDRYCSLYWCTPWSHFVAWVTVRVGNEAVSG